MHKLRFPLSAYKVRNNRFFICSYTPHFPPHLSSVCVCVSRCNERHTVNLRCRTKALLTALENECKASLWWSWCVREHWRQCLLAAPRKCEALNSKKRKKKNLHRPRPAPQPIITNILFSNQLNQPLLKSSFHTNYCFNDLCGSGATWAKKALKEL